MDFDYSPWNPVIWSLFGAFLFAVTIIVAVFHKKYPDYAKRNEPEDE
jgi:hypothetical protein